MGRAFCIGVGLIIASIQVHATEGYELIGLGPLQKGVAGAGAASGEDSSWMLLNPAAIASIESRADFYVDVILPTAELEPDGLIANPFAGDMSFSDIKFAPGGGAIWKKGKWTFGAGLYGIGGDSADFERSRTILTLLSNADRRAEILIAEAPFTVAREFDNGWSIGASLIGAAIRFRTDTLTLSLRPTEGENEWDTSVGVGFNAGIIKKWKRFALGLSYHSRTAMTDLDRYDDLIVFHLDLPEKFRAGVAVDVTKKLELLLDYKRINWSDVAQQGKPPIQNGLGWKDQHIYKIGLRYKLNDKWKLRAGFSDGNSPVPDGGVFINSIFPALSNEHISAGVTYAAKDNLDVHFSASHAFRNQGVDDGRGGIFSLLGRGTRSSLEVTSFQFGASYKF